MTRKIQLETRLMAASQPEDSSRENASQVHKRARTLLLAIDGSPGSDAALRYAARYARLLAPASVKILYIKQALKTADDREALAMPEARVLLDAAGVAHSWQIEFGDPAQTIVELSAYADEIVMGRTGVGKAKEMLVGSVTQGVLMHASRPVTVVASDFGASRATEAEDKQGIHRLLLGVDGSQPALRAADYVCGLVRNGAKLHVDLLNVVGPLPPGYLWETLTLQDLDRYYQQRGNRSLFQARAALVAAGVDFDKHIAEGYILDRLVDAAQACECSRIVMGHHGFGALRGEFLDSMAYRAIHASPVPVTLVR